MQMFIYIISKLQPNYKIQNNKSGIKPKLRINIIKIKPINNSGFFRSIKFFVKKPDI